MGRTARGRQREADSGGPAQYGPVASSCARPSRPLSAIIPNGVPVALDDVGDEDRGDVAEENHEDGGPEERDHAGDERIAEYAKLGEKTNLQSKLQNRVQMNDFIIHCPKPRGISMHKQLKRLLTQKPDNIV